MVRLAFLAAFIPACLASSLVAAGMAGLWFGEQTKDPITDKNRSMAFIYDDRDRGSIAVRCRENQPDILLVTNETRFEVGREQGVFLRFGSNAPLKLSAIPTEPTILALNAAGANAAFVGFTRNDPIAVRFTGEFGREMTMTFKAALLTNSLHMVGRVLADCGIAAYPATEIEQATQDLQRNAQSKPTRKK